MKFGQSIEYNLRNIFLRKSYTKCGAVPEQNVVPELFLKIQK